MGAVTDAHTWIARAQQLLDDDARRIETLIHVQMEHVTTRKCPLYEEVLDTQLYGYSRAVDFAIRVGLLSERAGKDKVHALERTLARMYEAVARAHDEKTAHHTDGHTERPYSS
ncbi:MAG: DUF1507 family protein [Paenibacillaceae bacterium]|nr:DUF1507 family protein [Paenibacillaceae bacterium]